jgi:hypothetical protein
VWFIQFHTKCSTANWSRRQEGSGAGPADATDMRRCLVLHTCRLLLIETCLLLIVVVGLPACGRQGAVTQKRKHMVDRIALRGLLSSWWPASGGWLQPAMMRS